MPMCLICLSLKPSPHPLFYNTSLSISIPHIPMEFSYPEDSKSSGESERNDYTGTGRSYECVFCKRGFSTAQALGGHMNIHRKDRAKTKPSFPPSTSIKVADLGFYSPIPTRPEVYNNYPQIYFPTPAYGTIRSSHLQYRDRDLFGEDWRRGLSLYTNPFCVLENKEKVQDKREEDGLDLELRLGYPV